jgi:tetratricopeptide (TPR) repeat protein
VIEEKSQDRFSLTGSYEIFTKWLVESDAPWQSTSIDTTEATELATIALEFSQKGQIAKALSMYQKSLAIYQEIGHKNGIALTHQNIGTLFKKMQNLDEALRHFESALEIHKSLNHLHDMAKDYTNIGLIYQQKSKNHEALKFFDEALRIVPNLSEALDAKRLLDWKMPKAPTKKKIFISYAHEDAHAANRLFNELKEFDDPDDPHLKLFLDKEILPGQKWRNVLENALMESQYFIILLSTNSIEKNTEAFQEELKVAIDTAKKHPDNERYIIPIRLDDCEIFETLQDLHTIDFFPDWKYGFEKILYALGFAKTDRLAEYYWENLLTSIDQKQCIPIIGASALEFFKQIDDGAFITPKDLAKELAEKYDYPFQDIYQLSTVAQFVAVQEANEIFPKELISHIMRQMKPPDFLSEKYEKSPYSVLAQLNLSIYITTNYDFLLEEALKTQGKDPVSEICRWNDELIKLTKTELIPSVFEKTLQYKPTPGKPLVFHLFGSIDYPSSMVLTESDYLNYITNTNKIEIEREILPTHVRRELARSTLLFVGYSFDGIDLRSLFQGPLSFMSTIPRNTNDIAVLQNIDIDDTSAKGRITKYIEKYTANMFKIKVYWGTMDDFFVELRKIWNIYQNKEL